MRKLLPLLLLVALPLYAQTTPADNPARGYEAETLNMDLDNDFVYTDADVCDEPVGTSGVVAVDYDGDSTTEGEIYVSATGEDDATCGGTGGADGPCATIEYAVANRTGTQDGEDAICIYDSVLTEGDIAWNVSGDAGEKTRLQGALEAIEFKYPQNPLILMGADADGDGLYPPEDTDDIAVIDAAGFDRCIEFGNVNRIELAHFTAQDCGNLAVAPTTGGIGFVSNIQNYFYFHNLKLLRINQDQPTDSDHRNFQANTNDFHFFAVENVLCDQCAGYGLRGGFDDGSGPMRWENYSRLAHGKDTDGGGATHMDYWNVTGNEIISSVLDGNNGAWSPQRATGIGNSQCSQDLHIVNSDIIDTQISFEHSDSNFCNAGGRPTGGTVTINGNSFWISADYNQAGYSVISFSDDSGVSTTNRLQGQFVISNNIMYIESGSGGELFGFVTGQIDADPGGGDIIVVNNTIRATNCFFNGGLINLTAGASPWNNFTVKNNIIENTTNSSDCDNINLDWAPSGWDSDYNRFDGSGNSAYVWNDSGTGSLAGWRAATGGDDNSAECDAEFANEGTNDFHLAANDLCALDNGATLLSVTDADYDGPDNRPVNSWDIGADEAEEGEDPPAPDPGDGIVLSGSGLDGSNTQ